MALKRRLKILDCDTETEDIRQTGLVVAFASDDMKHVNQHFGSTTSFVSYAVNPDGSKMLEVTQFDGSRGQPDNEDKLAEKLAALAGCIAVYSQAVGASAVRQLKQHGIQPVKVSAGAEIADLLASVQDELRSGPGTWLARAIESQRPSSPHRFDDMEAEGWDE